MPVVEEKRGVLTRFRRKPVLNGVHKLNGRSKEADVNGFGDDPTPHSSPSGAKTKTGSKSREEVLRQAEADLDCALAEIRLPGKPDLEADVRARAAARLRARGVSA